MVGDDRLVVGGKLVGDDWLVVVESVGNDALVVAELAGDNRLDDSVPIGRNNVVVVVKIVEGDRLLNDAEGCPTLSVMDAELTMLFFHNK